MSALPTNPSIAELREEFLRNDVRGWLWAWLADALRVYVRTHISTRYKAALYSPTGVWDDAGITDVVTDFLLDRGIGKGAVLAALQRANNTAGVVRYLETAVHHFAISERVRTVSGNIFHRLADVLASDPELGRLGALGSRPAYGDATWRAAPPPVLGEGDLREAQRHFPSDVGTTEYHHGARQSPGVASDDLRRIARALIRGTGRLMTAGQIMRSLEARFELRGDGSEPEEGLDAADRAGSLAATPLEETVAADLAERALGLLTPRQRQVLGLWVSANPPLTVREIGARISLGKSLVSEEQQAVAAVFRRLHLAGADEQTQVLAAVGRILHG